jgi:hypothetical protein
MATKVRFAVTFEGSDERHAYCLKGLLDVDEMQCAPRIDLRAEADFYCKVAPHMDVRVPDCVVAVVDREAQQARHHHARPDRRWRALLLRARGIFTADDAASSLRQLATLHAGSALLDTQNDWIVPRSGQIARMPQSRRAILSRR